MKIGTSMGLMVLVAALLMGTAAAQTTQVTGNVAESTTVTVNVASAAFGDFDIGENTKEVTDLLTVTTNDDVIVQASEASGDGKMSVVVESTTYTLASALKVAVGTGFTAVAIGASPVAVSGTITAPQDGTSYDGTFVQDVALADTIADGYSITVTFTSTPA